MFVYIYMPVLCMIMYICVCLFLHLYVYIYSVCMYISEWKTHAKTVHYRIFIAKLGKTICSFKGKKD